MDFKRLNAISNKSKGIICILFAALGFSFMTFFVRISGDIPTMEKAFFRNAVAIVVSLFMLVRTKEKISIKKGCGGDIFFRCLFGKIQQLLICLFFIHNFNSELFLKIFIQKQTEIFVCRSFRYRFRCRLNGIF